MFSALAVPRGGRGQEWRRLGPRRPGARHGRRVGPAADVPGHRERRLQPLVRVESGERIRVGRALDRGARGVMVPQVDVGRRRPERWLAGCAPSRGASAASPCTREAWATGVAGHEGAAGMHEELLGIVQIETRSALEQSSGSPPSMAWTCSSSGPPTCRTPSGSPASSTIPTSSPPSSEWPRRRSDTARRPASSSRIRKMWEATRAKGFTFFGISTSKRASSTSSPRESLRTAREAIAGATAPEVV